MFSLKRTLVLFEIALCAALLHGALFYGYIGKRFEPMVMDLWFKMRGAVEAPSQLIMVEINLDDYRERQVGLIEFWPRETHIELLKKLAAFKPKGVVFDLAFVDRYGKPGVDLELAQAIKLLPVVLAASSQVKSTPGKNGPEKEIRPIWPLEIFKESAAAMGHISVAADYSVVRRFAGPRLIDGKSVQPLAVEAARLFSAPPSIPSPRDFIKFYGPAGSITSVPYRFFLKDGAELNPGSFKDKVVFVGYYLPLSAKGAARDTHNSPFDELTFGAEIHATAAANIINQDWIRRAPVLAEGLGLLVFVVFVSYLLLSLHPVRGAMVLALTFLLWSAASYLGFLYGRFVPGVLAAAVVLPLIYFANTLYVYVTTRLRELKLRSALSKYVGPEVLNEIISTPGALELQAKLRDVAVLFTDLKSFSALSANQQSSKSLYEVMTRCYFNHIEPIVREARGTVLGFYGDGMLAIWGAPLEMQDSAARAFSAALQIEKRLRLLREEHPELNLETRIGLDYGEAFVGNLGSEERFDYSAIGDAINSAARLQSLNKFFGTTVVASGRFLAKLGGRAKFFCLMRAVLPGAKEALKLYALFDPAPAFLIRLSWHRSLKAFSEKNYAKALELFLRCASKEPRLKVSGDLYCRIIDTLKQSPCSKNWRGETVFEAIDELCISNYSSFKHKEIFRGEVSFDKASVLEIAGQRISLKSK